MPIVDLLVVVAGEAALPDGAPQRVADALGATFGAAPGRVWVRARALPSTGYAENGGAPPPSGLPAFVTLLHAVPPEGAARAEEARRVAESVARALGRPADTVHVEYAPAGQGRIAFGGRLPPDMA